MGTISYKVDASQLMDYAGELLAAVDLLADELPKVTERGAVNIKRDARRLLNASITRTYLPHYPRAITYEMEQGADYVQADIGPESGKPQGGMGRGVEFGSVHTPPTPHLFPAFEAEEPRYLKAIGQAVNRSLK